MDTLRIKCKLLDRPLTLRIGIIKSLATCREKRDVEREEGNIHILSLYQYYHKNI